MPLDPNILNDIGQPNQAVGRLASIFDPTVIQARQLDQARNEQAQGQIARANKLQELLGGGNTADFGATAQMLGKNGYGKEAAEYQGLQDAQQQRNDAMMQRRAKMLADAHGRIGAMGGGDEAIDEHYSALGLTPEQIKGKKDWLAANVAPEKRGAYFLDVSDPARITKREEFQAKAEEAGAQKAADRAEREAQAKQRAQERMQELNIRMEDSRLSREDRAAARAESNDIRRSLVNVVGKLTEDQGKATGWLAQADNAYANMKGAIDADSKVVAPTAAEALASKFSPDVANALRSDNRQKFVQAASSMSEALLRAATGAGVNENEARQKIQELTPLYTDKPGVRKQKLDAIPVYMESLKVRSGPGAQRVNMKSDAVNTAVASELPPDIATLLQKHGGKK